MMHPTAILKTLLATTILILLTALVGCDGHRHEMGCYPPSRFAYDDRGSGHGGYVHADSRRGGHFDARDSRGYGRDYASRDDGWRRH